MFNGQYTSINRIIENILKDTDYYNEVDQNDITEWAVRAMELIGAPLAYEEVIETIPVVNYRAELPIDVREILGVRDHRSRHTLVMATDDWIMGNYQSTLDIYNPACLDPYVIEDDGRMEDKGLTGLFSYRVNNGWMFLNAKEGCIDVHYTQFPMDDDGCLLIPDVERYLMAVESYVIYKIDNKLYRKGIIAKNIRDDSEQNWLWYVSSAHSKMVTPNYDKAEALKNQIQKMGNDSNAHDYGFEHMNVPTRRRASHYRGYGLAGNRRRF